MAVGGCRLPEHRVRSRGKRLRNRNRETKRVIRHSGNGAEWHFGAVSGTQPHARECQLGSFREPQSDCGRRYREPIAPEVRALLTTGFCGGYTTFSTFSYDTLLLLEDGEGLRAGTYVLLSVVLSLIGTWLGTMAARELLAMRSHT